MTNKKSLGERVTGQGFSTEELAPDEKAKLRETINILHREFLSPEEFIRQVPPMVIAKHLALGALVSATIFARDNKGVIATVVGFITALNYETVIKVVEIILQSAGAGP